MGDLFRILVYMYFDCKQYMSCYYITVAIFDMLYDDVMKQTS